MLIGACGSMACSIHVSRRQAAQASGFDFGRLDRNLAYFFELCHPATTVVIAHPRPRLVHLGTRDSVTFREVPDADIGVERPRLFPLGSARACAAAALALGPESEGYSNFDIGLHHFRFARGSQFSAFSIIMPPPRAPCDVSYGGHCLCQSDADWCLQSDAMADLRLKLRRDVGDA